MAKWYVLSGRFPVDEMKEINRIKDQYGLSYNKIIREGIKFYLALTFAKESFTESKITNKLEINGKSINAFLKNPKFQKKMDVAIFKFFKLIIAELFGTFLNFKSMKNLNAKGNIVKKVNPTK